MRETKQRSDPEMDFLHGHLTHVRSHLARSQHLKLSRRDGGEAKLEILQFIFTNLIRLSAPLSSSMRVTSSLFKAPSLTNSENWHNWHSSLSVSLVTPIKPQQPSPMAAKAEKARNLSLLKKKRAVSRNPPCWAV